MLIHEAEQAERNCILAFGQRRQLPEGANVVAAMECSGPARQAAGGDRRDGRRKSNGQQRKEKSTHSADGQHAVVPLNGS
ncbi:hypothetical protein [Bradyrhizobium sp. USDA 10063]